MYSFIYALLYKEMIMSLPHALLGLINYQPSTGYELRSLFSESIQFFWNATLPQIYRTLNQMESQGWLTVRIEPQEGKPSRKIYSITDVGREELTRWLVTRPEIAPERNPLLLKVFFGRIAGLEALKKIITGYREYHAKLLQQYDTETVNVINHYADACDSQADAAYWKLTLDFGQRYSEMVVGWCDHALTAIGQTSGAVNMKKKKTAKPRGGRL